MFCLCSLGQILQLECWIINWKHLIRQNEVVSQESVNINQYVVACCLHLSDRLTKAKMAIFDLKLRNVVSSICESCEQPPKYVFMFVDNSWNSWNSLKLREDQNIIITF